MKKAPKDAKLTSPLMLGAHVITQAQAKHHLIRQKASSTWVLLTPEQSTCLDVWYFLSSRLVYETCLVLWLQCLRHIWHRNTSLEKGWKTLAKLNEFRSKAVFQCNCNICVTKQGLRFDFAVLSVKECLVFSLSSTASRTSSWNIFLKQQIW